MKSDDYFKGYMQGVEDVLDKIDEAKKEFLAYEDRKNFKGLSRRDVVQKCWNMISDAVKEFRK